MVLVRFGSTCGMSIYPSFTSYSYWPRMEARQNILTRSFWGLLFCVRFRCNQTFIGSTPRLVDCPLLHSCEPALQNAGDALCVLIRHQRNLKELARESGMFSFRADAWIVPHWMGTHLWIDERVCRTWSSAIGKTNSSHTGVRWRGDVSAPLSCCYIVSLFFPICLGMKQGCRQVLWSQKAA